MIQKRGNLTGSIILAVLIITALLASLSIILITDSATSIMKPVDLLAEADDSVSSATAQLYSSDVNSDNNDDAGVAAAQSTKDNNI
ncbi:MAG TPA: hypothetical protein VFZ60_06785, partial [Nitrososphaeraceae archaeon]